MIEKHTPQRAADKFAERLRAQIRDGKLKAGDRLPPIHTLAKQADIGSYSVSKAIGILVAEGLLEAAPKKGTFVTDPSSQRKSGKYGKLGVIGAFSTSNQGMTIQHPVIMSGLVQQASESEIDLDLITEEIKESPEEVFTTLKKRDIKNLLWLTPPVEKKELIENLKTKGIQSLIFAHSSYDFSLPTVCSNTTKGGYLVGKELLKRNCSNVQLYIKPDFHDQVFNHGIENCLSTSNTSIKINKHVISDDFLFTKNEIERVKTKNTCFVLLATPSSINTLRKEREYIKKLANDNLVIVRCHDAYYENLKDEFVKSKVIFVVF